MSPAPDPDAVKTAASDRPDLQSKGGQYLPWIYPYDPVKDQYDPTQVILETDGSVTVTITGAATVNAYIGGVPEQHNFATAGAAPVTVTFSGTSKSVIILNDALQWLEFSLDGGTTWTALGPRGFIGENWQIGNVQIRRQGAVDVSGSVINTC